PEEALAPPSVVDDYVPAKPKHKPSFEEMQRERERINSIVTYEADLARQAVESEDDKTYEHYEQTGREALDIARGIKSIYGREAAAEKYDEARVAFLGA